MTSASARLKKLKNRVHPADDEFYTQKEEIDHMLGVLEEAGHPVAGLHTLSPCDTRESLFPQRLAAHGARADASSGDFRLAEFRGYDLVATNPPFSLIIDFTDKLAAAGVDFAILAPITHLANPLTAQHLINGSWSAFNGLHGGHMEFTRPAGGTSGAPALWITSLQIPDSLKEPVQPRGVRSVRLLSPGLCPDGTQVLDCPRLPLPEDAPLGTLVAAPLVAFTRPYPGYTPRRVEYLVTAAGATTFKRVVFERTSPPAAAPPFLLF